MQFDLYLAGQDDPVEFDDERFVSAEALARYIRDEVRQHPTWITLGGVTVHSQNIIAAVAVEEETA